MPTGIEKALERIEEGLIAWTCTECGELQRWPEVPDDELCVDCHTKMAERMDRGRCLRAAGCPAAVRNRPFDETKVEGSILEQVGDWSGEPWALYFYGQVGSGKTMLATELLWRQMLRLPPPEQFSGVMPDLWIGKLCLWRTMRRATGDWINNRSLLQHATALVIDDVGQFSSEGMWDMFGEIVDARYSEGKATVLTGQLPPGEIYRQRPHIGDRLRDAIRVKFTGQSQRGKS